MRTAFGVKGGMFLGMTIMFVPIFVAISWKNGDIIRSKGGMFLGVIIMFVSIFVAIRVKMWTSFGVKGGCFWA